MKLLAWSAWFILAASASAMAASLHVDDFEDGTAMGWSGGMGAPPANQSTGGPAGDGDGYLRVVATGTNLATYSASPAWIGDFAAIGAVQITVDMMSPAESAPLDIRAVLFGPTHTFNRWTSAASQAVPNDGVWRSYTFSIAPADLVLVLGSGTYPQMMADVQRVMLRHDPGAPTSGGSAVNGILNIDNVALAAAAPPATADFNGDGHTDGADLEAWRTGYGAAGNATPAQGDANGDLDVDGADFLLWQRQYTGPGAPELQAVPEPAAIHLAAAACLAALCRRRGSL